MTRCTALLLAAASGVAGSPARLLVRGSQLIDPDSGNATRITGFSWALKHVHVGDASHMRSLLPGANLVRLVALHWDDGSNDSDECMVDTPPYISAACLDRLDWALRIATNASSSIPGRRLWVVLACRGSVAAGSDPSQPSVFTNRTLRGRMIAMWQHVAARYAGWEGIGAYELLSEPRPSATQAQITDFYSEACGAVHAIDGATPCVVGPPHYYKLWELSPATILPKDRNVIYTFDFFEPAEFSAGKERVPAYPGTYACSDLFPGWVDPCCAAGAAANTSFDRKWVASTFERWALPLRASKHVPLFVNQWAVVHGVDEAHGRYAFMADVAEALQRYGIGWSWWNWRGGGGDGWAHGSSEFVCGFANGSVALDTLAFDAVRGAMSDTDQV